MAAVFTAAWPKFDDVIGALDDVGIVLDDDKRISKRLERFHNADELLRILRM